MGISNPARNVGLFTKLYSMPSDHYINFIGIGAVSGYIFFYYIQYVTKPDLKQEDAKIDLRIVTFLKRWKKNLRARILLFFVSLGLFFCFFVAKYYSTVSDWPFWLVILF